MDLSIIIVSWNAKAFLSECLQSIAEATARGQSEIIVVDNASTDGSAELVKERFSQVQLISNGNNLGFAKANNIGVRLSKGKYVCLINSDVVVGRDCIARSISFMEENRRVGVLGPKILDRHGRVQRSCMSFPTLWNTLCGAFAFDCLFPKSKFFASHLMRYWQHDRTRSVDVINGCFWTIRRSAMEEVGLLDENFFIYGEDMDWCKRFHDAGWDVVFFPEAEAIHYGGASSANAPIRFLIEQHRANHQYWRKHSGLLLSFMYLLLTLVHNVVRFSGHLIVYWTRPAERKATRSKLLQNKTIIAWVFNNIKCINSAFAK